MIRSVLIAIAAVALMLSAVSATNLDPGPARIRLTAELVSERIAPTGIVQTYALFNRPAYPDRIGTGIATCVTVARGWLDCSHMLRLSRGVIVARSIVPTAAAVRVLAVLGGTGYYANTGGEMVTQPVGGGGQLILVNLHAF